MQCGVLFSRCYFIEQINRAQGSTEGGFLPSTKAKAEGAKNLRPSAKDHTANIYHPAIVKLQPKADKVKEKIYN